MLEFFLALFGGTYYASKLSKERSENIAFEKKSSEHIEFNRILGERVRASCSLEKEIEDIINNYDEIDAVYDMIADNLRVIFGENYRMDFIISPFNTFTRTSFDVSNGYWAKQLLLSKRGKVGNYEYASGYPLGRESEVEVNLKICRQIEKNLQAARTGLKLVLKPGATSDPSRWNPCGKSMIFEHQLFWNEDKNKARMW